MKPLKNTMQTQLAKSDGPVSRVDDDAKAWKLLGSITTLQTMGQNLAQMCEAEAIRGLEQIEELELFRAMGYKTFVDFLNSDHCFIGKNAYYTRRELLHKEGEQLYDVFNGLEISMRKRKLLGKGSLEIDGNDLVFTETDERVPLTDRKRLLEILTIAVDANVEKTAKIEKGEADIRRLKEKLFDAETESSPRSAIPDLDKAHMVASGAIAALADEIARLDERACQAYLDGPMNLLATQYQRLNDEIGRILGTSPGADDIRVRSLGQMLSEDFD